MAGEVNPEKLWIEREFLGLKKVLAVSTPRKLREVQRLSQRIKAHPGSKVKRGK